MPTKRTGKVSNRGKLPKKRTSNVNNNLLLRTFRLGKLPRVAFIAIFAGVGSYLLITSFAASNQPPPMPFVEAPARGLVWAGLKAPQAGSACGRLYELANSNAQVPMCTHGPDPAPEGVDVRKSVEPVRTGEDDRTAENASSTSGTAASSLMPCDGDGTTGKRVQGIYVRASDVPSRLSTFAESFQTYAARANNQYLESAKQTNGERNIRWVHDAICRPVIPEVVISPTGDGTFDNSINELKALGYNRTDRKYILWVDAAVYCGIASIYADDRADSGNINNGTYAMYGRSDSGCWGYAEAHELMHNLGGVQATAPHATRGWHCTDEADEMCYVDASGVVLTNPCPYTNNQSTLFDCNHDDYYYAGVPPTGNYLLDHWNTANSNFLIGGVAPPPTSTICSNSLDDDGDSKIDYPADPGCSDVGDTSESPDPPPPGDTTAPTVSIVNPLNNATIQRRVLISANGYDNVRVTKMHIYIGAGLKATSAGTPINYTWSSNKASSGPHVITVKAWDAAGKVGQSSITVYK